MKLNHIVPSAFWNRSKAERLFIVWASIVVVSLLSFYVRLLDEAVVRGERFRNGPCMAAQAVLSPEARLECAR
jgi:hypothetical protein